MFASLDPVRHPPADTIIAYRSAASTVFRSSMATVIGPTPPGTGVRCPATAETPEVDVAELPSSGMCMPPDAAIELRIQPHKPRAAWCDDSWSENVTRSLPGDAQ